jgi:hypothetical protein
MSDTARNYSCRNYDLFLKFIIWRSFAIKIQLSDDYGDGADDIYIDNLS